MSTDTGKALAAAVMGIAFGLYSFATGFRTLRRKRLIENTPTSAIRALAMGLVEICGEALPCAEGQTLQSPFTKNDCLYYHYTIEEFRRQGKRSRWVTLQEHTEAQPFLLRDDTGTVLVDPTGAEVAIPQDYQSGSRLGIDPRPEVQDFLRAEGIAFEGWLGANKQMRFTEYYIALRDRLFILGTAGDNPHVAEGTGVDNAADIMIGRGGTGAEFYISDSSEKECVRKHALKVFFQVYGGMSLTLASFGFLLYLLDAMLHWGWF